MTKLEKEYRKNRQLGCPARWALVHARDARKRRPVPFDWGGYDGGRAEFKRAGFSVRVRVEPDNDGDISYLGSFSDGRERGAIARRDPDRNAYTHFVPAISYSEHYTALRADHSRGESDRLAREYVRRDMERAESYGTDWTLWGVIVTVYRQGVELGEASVWGVDAEPGAEYFEELADELTSEALEQARGSLSRLCKRD